MSACSRIQEQLVPLKIAFQTVGASGLLCFLSALPQVYATEPAKHLSCVIAADEGAQLPETVCGQPANHSKV